MMFANVGIKKKTMIRIAHTNYRITPKFLADCQNAIENQIDVRIFDDDEWYSVGRLDNTAYADNVGLTTLYCYDWDFDEIFDEIYLSKLISVAEAKIEFKRIAEIRRQFP